MNSPTPAPTESNPTSPAHDPPAARSVTWLRWFKRHLWISLLVLVVPLVIRVVAGDFDSAWATITTVILSGVVLVALLSKWTRNQPATRYWILPVTGAILVALALMSFRIDTFSGSLWPTFRLSWRPPHDESLGAPPVTGRLVDLAKSTPNDFPQFLGPQRANSVDHVRLDPDWKTNPPLRLWKRPIGAGWGGFVAVNGCAVTMEQRGPSELVTCYDIKTGEPHWSHVERTRHQSLMGGIGPRSTPTIDRGQVFTLGATGILCCLNGATGKPIWRFDLLDHYGISPSDETDAVPWGRAASPLVTESLVVIPAGGSAGQRVSLVALNRTDGQVAWEGGNRQVSYASPSLVTLAGAPQILIVNENTISAHDPRSGNRLWSHPWTGNSNSNASVSQALAVTDSMVLLSKGYGVGSELLQLDVDADQQFHVRSLWSSSRVLKTKFTNACLFEGHVYALSDGVLECVDISSGRRQWKRGRFGHGQLLRVESHLLVQAESGEIVLVQATPEGFRKLGSIAALHGQTWNNLCLYGRYLLARNAREATCFSLTTRPDSTPN
ncbi:MAG: hypothetical protein CMJ59_03560 [Planctomycetaceae bacterium]|nr:hypothetical protein [Planctomycetaceae bacterium]